MEALGDHPAIKVAFYNTEAVDDLWFDNLNREAGELSQKKLGFTREQLATQGGTRWQLGKPTFVAPGVIAATIAATDS